MKLEGKDGQTFEVALESVQIDAVALLSCRRAADVYIERLFDLDASFWVASADRYYPREPELREAVFRSLETDPKLHVVVFGYDAFREVNVRSERVLVMDQLLLGALYEEGQAESGAIRLSEAQIVTVMRSFLGQVPRRQNLGNYSHNYRQLAKYADDEDAWRLSLVTEES